MPRKESLPLLREEKEISHFLELFLRRSRVPEWIPLRLCQASALGHWYHLNRPLRIALSLVKINHVRKSKAVVLSVTQTHMEPSLTSAPSDHICLEHRDPTLTAPLAPAATPFLSSQLVLQYRPQSRLYIIKAFLKTLGFFHRKTSSFWRNHCHPFT